MSFKDLFATVRRIGAYTAGNVAVFDTTGNLSDGGSPAGSGINQLTGDVTAGPGSGSQAASAVWGNAILTPGTVASLPSPSKNGRIYLPTDGVQIYRDTGSVWQPWGPVFPFTPPVSGDFAWVNQGTASVDTTNGGIYLLGPASSGFNARVRKKAAPSTPYTITAVFLTTQISLNFQDVGICFRQSSDGKMHALALGCGTGTSVLGSDKYTSATAFSATYGNRSIVGLHGPLVFLRIADNGTNRICSFSMDGQHFIQFTSIGRTDFLTADEVGFFVNDQTNVYPLGATLLSWKEG